MKLKLLGCVSWLIMVAAVGLTVMFVGFKIAGVGTVATWEWYQVLMPAEIYAAWVTFWGLIGIIGVILDNRVPRSIRDPHHTFEPLRRFRAWRWERSQRKYNSEKEN